VGREEVVDPIVVDQEVVDRFKHRFRVVRTIAGECILGFGDRVTDNRLDRAVVLLDAPIRLSEICLSIASPTLIESSGWTLLALLGS